MIIFIEPLGKPYVHLSVLKTLLISEMNNTQEQFLFISSEAYYNSIPYEFRKKLQFKQCNLSSSSIRNIFEIFYLVISTFFKFRKNKHVKIYLLMSKSYTNFLLKIYSLFFLYGSKKLLIMIHGELQNVVLKGRMSAKFDGKMQRLTYWINSKIKTHLKFVIISNYVFEELSSILKYQPKNIISLDLPYQFEDFGNHIDRNLNCLSATTVGVNSVSKKSYLLNDVAKILKKEIENGTLSLNAIGRNEGIRFSCLVNLPNFNDGYFLTPEEYAKRILSNDVLLFFNDDDYKLISSGSYFDSINYSRPILAMRTEQWTYNFNKFGAIGFLCSNIEEMAMHLRNGINDYTYFKKFDFELEKARLNIGIDGKEERVLSILNQ